MLMIHYRMMFEKNKLSEIANKFLPVALLMVAILTFSACGSLPVPDGKGGSRRVVGTVADTEDVNTAWRFQYIKKSGERELSRGNRYAAIRCFEAALSKTSKYIYPEEKQSIQNSIDKLLVDLKNDDIVLALPRPGFLELRKDRAWRGGFLSESEYRCLESTESIVVRDESDDAESFMWFAACNHAFSDSKRSGSEITYSPDAATLMAKKEKAILEDKIRAVFLGYKDTVGFRVQIVSCYDNSGIFRKRKNVKCETGVLAKSIEDRQWIRIEGRVFFNTGKNKSAVFQVLGVRHYGIARTGLGGIVGMAITEAVREVEAGKAPLDRAAGLMKVMMDRLHSEDIGKS